MMYYRFYLLDVAGHVVRREESYCADEAEALEKARKMCKVHDIEVWQGTKQIAVINCADLRNSFEQGGSAASA